MLDEKFMTRFMNESYQLKQKYEQLYKRCTDIVERRIYRNSYYKSLGLYSSRYQMLLAFGYDVVFDENDNIIGIKKI